MRDVNAKNVKARGESSGYFGVSDRGVKAHEAARGARLREHALFDVVAGKVVGMADGLGNGNSLLHDEPFLPKGAIIRIVAGERLGQLFDPICTL